MGSGKNHRVIYGHPAAAILNFPATGKEPSFETKATVFCSSNYPFNGIRSAQTNKKIRVAELFINQL